ncbi:hypothetical protein JKP88DRAFT_273576 [Tribonema minus]|uniref:Uncharacterized protein n=1 Tax=Tribonema minus TaxID=303371 RepID=A0A835YRB4_9STRA|nr:hypothetical protein JKP88DRAFT_273576 [Tribonema minus]
MSIPQPPGDARNGVQVVLVKQPCFEELPQEALRGPLAAVGTLTTQLGAAVAAQALKQQPDRPLWPAAADATVVLLVAAAEAVAAPATLAAAVTVGATALPDRQPLVLLALPKGLSLGQLVVPLVFALCAAAAAGAAAATAAGPLASAESGSGGGRGLPLLPTREPHVAPELSADTHIRQAPKRWDGFVPTGTETYIPPMYAPSSSADRNHALFSAVRDNDFDKSSDSYEKGLITGMGIIAGVGMLCLLFAPLAYTYIGRRGSDLNMTIDDCELEGITGMGIIAGVGVLCVLFAPLSYAYIGRRANCCHATKAKRPGAGGAAIVFGLMWAIAAVTSAGEDAGQVATLLTQAQQLAAEAADAAAQTLTVAQSILDEGEKCVTKLPLPMPLPKQRVGKRLVTKNRAAVVEQLRTYADAVAALAASDNFNDAIRMVSVIERLRAAADAAAALVASDNFNDAIRMCVDAAAALAASDNFIDAIRMCVDAVAALAASNNFNDAIRMVTQNVADGIDDSQAWRLPVIAVVATIFGACMLIYLATAILIILKGKLIFKRRDGTFAACCSLRGKPIFKRRDGTFAARCSLRALTAVTVTSLILMWALFTAAIGSAMAGGDFSVVWRLRDDVGGCDPDANTVAVADGNTVVAFYVNCQGDDPLFTAVSQGQEALVTAMGTLAPLADKIFGNRLVAAVCNANVAALGDSLDRLNSLSYRASTLATQAQEDFSCRTINGLYVDAVYETGCRDVNAACFNTINI